jgi:hypothetical protein
MLLPSLFAPDARCPILIPSGDSDEPASGVRSDENLCVTTVPFHAQTSHSSAARTPWRVMGRPSDEGKPSLGFTLTTIREDPNLMANAQFG